MILPILISYYTHEIDISKFQFNKLSLFTSIFLILYYFIQYNIYSGYAILIYNNNKTKISKWLNKNDTKKIV